jgi:xanthine dehydrogenase YagR molybdenum-binding subunit
MAGGGAAQGVRGVAGHGGVKHPGGLLPWAEILADGPAASFVGARAARPRRVVLPADRRRPRGRQVHRGALHVFEVEVDTRLGRTKVLRSFTGSRPAASSRRCSRAARCSAGSTQGISYALYEERRLDPRSGLLLTGGLEDYRIAGIGDVGASGGALRGGGLRERGGGGVGLAELMTLAPARRSRTRCITRPAFARATCRSARSACSQGWWRHERRDQLS